MRNLTHSLTVALSATLALSATSAFAQPYNGPGSLVAPGATEATVGLHVPLGGSHKAPAQATYDASFGYRAGGGALTESRSAPVAKLAEFSFTGGKVDQARVGSFDFASAGSTNDAGERLGFSVGGLSPGWSVVAVVVGVAVVGLVLFPDKGCTPTQAHLVCY